MWEKLRPKDREKYKTLITNFASLSEAFSQKSEADSDDKKDIVSPIVNSKFQETVFQKSFNAVGEDIANTSFDASVLVDDNHKYLVGIKSFGFNSGDQKIAQFKKNSQEWSNKLALIKSNSERATTKDEADEYNKENYYWLAREIAILRNQRIASSKAQIKGFNSDDVNVESVYHVLMPTKKGDKPQIFVGETSYLPIDLDSLRVLGATNLKNPTNFRFTDGQHTYKYTSADSQLYMTFNNEEIVVDTWDVAYIEDPFYVFENLHLLSNYSDLNDIDQTVSWMIANKDNEVEASSGFNGFNGGSKLSRKNRYREKRIEQLLQNYEELLHTDELAIIEKYLMQLLIPKYRSNEETHYMRELRQEFMDKLLLFADSELIKDIEKLIYRDSKEVYIPIPDSKNFHTTFPDFFGNQIGTFKEGGKTLALEKEQRKFILKFLASGDEIEAYINQDNGKAIQSTKKQGILGEWLLKGVFQLQDREVLSYERLEELHINAIRLTKFTNGKIGIEFIWIDSSNPPQDAIGWVVKNKD